MHAIPKDPEWLYVYWEISEPSINELKHNMGAADFVSSKKLLRLYDVTDADYKELNAQCYCDQEIDRIANSWYIKVPESGRKYFVECGFLTSAGRFFPVVRSNGAKIPRLGQSPVLDQEWSSATSDELFRMSADGLKSNMGASENRPSIMLAEVENPEGFWGLLGHSGTGMFGMPISGPR
jgi:hypothetical protein